VFNVLCDYVNYIVFFGANVALVVVLVRRLRAVFEEK
jgi:hypothetical protein